MTKISYVSGIAPTGQTQQDNTDYLLRGEAPVLNLNLGTFDYLQMTLGEGYMQLLKRQAKMYAASYPSLRVNYGGVMVNPYVQAEKNINDMIYNGLHANFDSSAFEKLSRATGGYFEGLIYAAKAAKKAFKPASDILMFGKDRNQMTQGTDPERQIGEIITFDNCTSYIREDGNIDYNENTYLYLYSPELGREAYFKEVIGDADCLKKQEFRDVFNKELPTISPQLLYTFVTDAILRGGIHGSLDSVALARITNKASDHSKAIETFSRVSTLDKAILTQWIYTEIMAANQRKGFAPLTPEEIIIIMRDTPEAWNISPLGDPNNDYRIGGFWIIIAWAVFALAACAGAATILQVVQGREPTALAYMRGIFTAVISPAGKDWGIPDLLGGGGTNTGGGCSNPSQEMYKGRCVDKCPTGYSRNLLTGECEKDVPKSEGLSTKTMILIGGGVAAAAGLILLSSDNKKA